MKPDTKNDTEDDFWDLGDEEDLPLSSASQTEDDPGDDAEEKGSEGEASDEEAERSSEDSETSGKGDKDGDDDEAADEDQKKSEKKEKKKKSLDDDLLDDLDEEELKVEREKVAETPSDKPEAKEGDSEAAPPSSSSWVEKAALLALLIIFIAAASWGISTYYDHAPEGDLVEFTETFPVEGQHTSLAEIETYWREPIRSGENVDRGIQLRASLIPCARIVLKGSGNAALALSFRDSELNLIGDPISLDVKDGLFTKTGTAEISITSTAGFENISEINSYINLDIDPWSVLIVEGAPGTNPSYTEADKKLAVVRISAETR